MLLAFIYNHGYKRRICDILYLICILLPKMGKLSGTAYPPRASGFIHGVMVVSALLIFLALCVVLLCVFAFWISCCDIRYDFRINQCSVCLFFQLFVGGSMPFLRCLCLYAVSGVLIFLCYVFALFFIVLCTLCCQFLWIVHCWLTLRYYLTLSGGSGSKRKHVHRGVICR